MAYDNTCKYLAEKFPAAFVSWLLPIDEPTDIQVLKTELIQEPIRADSLVFLQTDNQILHLEFETRPYSDPPIAFRMLDYYVRLKRQYSCSINQVVIFLQQTASEQVFVSEYTDANTRHGYRVIRLWEQDPALLLSVPGLLPLATLSQTNSPRTLLEQIATQIATIQEPTQQADLLACTQVLAGLRFEKDLIRQLFRKETMRGSVIYQEIREDGLLEGRQLGLLEGRKDEALAFLTRQLTRRIGSIAPETREQIQTLSVEELEDLGEALLDFSSASDLTNWLNEHQP
ncbi:Rpn family recombination-promoting nuclease/putative transposase [Microcoleus sp. PH2017_28_MFU_U_A]|uniref:Rpn family recombination-promoting nuclease/putative transposase n=1 Tax=Microcoleus sp. PH2017_28_MFU_U_A TaxID=2798838 RepID=UPI001D8FA36B|nr:Rpn family recombination-promoting nuclease/putative transposase [Microcoleus sp. PH2017_28_MFU_U_A]MCC3591682.1 Rpn family recombination-promoting nuclease/putative transposase [Microcoleus sp. PH2017_28_MFU_U_A]